MEIDADTDVTMVPANTEPEAESASSSSALLASSSSSFKKNNKRFEIKKWNAVSLWAWDIVVDNCAICRNHIMDLYMYPLILRQIRLVLLARNALLLGLEHEKEEVDSEYEERESEGGEGDEVEANNGDDKMELLEEEYKHLKHQACAKAAGA